ncbi:hypothetical protein [Roseburia sp. AM59-24XD]|jgi:hypothetical protein|uniref:hypothetical protein n=1 Tax=Roseburia sp. AM59-24XD TaxID=2293138 RepID=UPI000E54BD62|nr:hypothetical protein [Roseburia sp. AM59-24XD]RHP87780.1 hypothetical protein DXA20_03015 [Roseburia sp. AM59-24XD]DAZ61721.1 MAG TPA: Major head protein [Caudoviricetes sp.]
MRKKEFIPMNLQLFAEPPAGGDGDAGDTSATGGKSGEGSNKADLDGDDDVSLAEQVAQLKVQNAKLKKANDKATSEAASYKKQLREKQTAEEIALQEKAEKEAEREEQFQKLLRENTITKFEKNFLALGYPADLAAKAAAAQCDNDTDELFSIQQTFIEEKEKTMKADWMKSMPNPPAGNSDDDEDAFLKGFNM